MLKRSVFLLIAALFVASPVFAQSTRVPVEHNQTISTNPITDILGFINGEYQRKVGESTTVGVSAAIFDLDDDGFASVMVLGRYYPQGAALTGFFFGGRAGIHRIEFDRFEPSSPDFSGPPVFREITETRAAIGVDVGYDWLLGSKRNVYIGLGGGAVRILGDVDDFFIETYPTVRVNIGFAF